MHAFGSIYGRAGRYGRANVCGRVICGTGGSPVSRYKYTGESPVPQLTLQEECLSTAAPTYHTAKGGYDVAPSLGKCFISGRVIEPDEKFITALRETTDGFERVDVASEHWNEFDRAGVLAFWQTAMRRPEQKKKQFVDDQVLCELFDRLGTATEANKISFRFVLGLILMRKRLLIYESSRREGDHGIWSVRLKGRTQSTDLFDPKLDEQQMMDVTKHLGQILNEEL